MNPKEQNLEAIQDIRKMMERSSRFITLSGWSGIAAGICALAGAWIARNMLQHYQQGDSTLYEEMRERFTPGAKLNILERDLLILAITVFIAACASAFVFTYLKSKKHGVPVLGRSAQRLVWNTFLPILAGALVIFRLLYLAQYAMLAPVCLIFYGLALVNGGKYTLGEIQYLGYLEIVLGAINLWLPGYGLVFWTFGFGVLHILYGLIMWRKYDYSPAEN